MNESGGMEGTTTMVSDQDIAQGLDTLLRQSEPNSITTLNGVVQQLETKLGLNLSHKAGFLRDHINLLLRSQSQLLPQFAHHFPPLSQSLPSSKGDTFPQNAVTLAPLVPNQSVPTGGKRRGGAGGLNKVCGVSPELQAIVGEPALARTEIVKQLWAYIRKNNLQDPGNKRKIICNDALRLVFETDSTDMFKMNNLLAKHIIPLGPTKESQAKRIKLDVENTTESAEPASSTVIISEALAKFLGTQERGMQQSEAIRLVWEYIKVNHLEDPLNAMAILCDAKLEELLGCESISALGIPEILARHHLFKRS